MSPNDTPAEVREKAQCWLAHGTFCAADELVAADLLPGFRCRVGELFAH